MQQIHSPFNQITGKPGKPGQMSYIVSQPHCLLIIIQALAKPKLSSAAVPLTSKLAGTRLVGVYSFLHSFQQVLCIALGTNCSDSRLNCWLETCSSPKQRACFLCGDGYVTAAGAYLVSVPSCQRPGFINNTVLGRN